MRSLSRVSRSAASVLVLLLLPALVAAGESAPEAPSPSASAGNVPTPPEKDWKPPNPPPLPPAKENKAHSCRSRTSHPLVSYRISGHCSITDIKAIGGYRYGVHQLKHMVQGFRSSREVRKFVNGNFRYELEIIIQLHRDMHPTSQLVCHTDMMRERVIDAKIAGPKAQTPLTITNGELPDLGTYSYGADVPYPAGTCPAKH